MIRFGNTSADRVTQAQWKNGQFLSISYTSLYIILDMYLYSKAPSPGVNDFGCHRTCFSCQLEIILPLVYPDIDTTPATNLQS